MNPDDWTGKAIADQFTILLGEVGSTVHGISVNTSDHDEMGICIEPEDFVLGLRDFEHYRHRDQPEGVRSQPGDTDRITYSLRKWTRLALKGNPSVLTLLFTPETSICDRYGEYIQENAGWFASKAAATPFLGYMTQQRERLLGVRGQLRVTRQELIDAYGFDTKYAMHMLRLGLQGVEYLSTGRMSLPMADEHRNHLLNVRTGKVPLTVVVEQAEALEEKIRDLKTTSPLPDGPHTFNVNQMLVDMYQDYWSRRI